MGFFWKKQPEQADELETPQFAEDLPEMCYSMLPGPKCLIQIRRGEETFAIVPRTEANSGLSPETLNQRMGLTKAQVSAMHGGLVYGWDSPQADPQYYEPETDQQMGIGMG